MTPYYSDDHVTIYHGDALTVGEWRTADLILTDPPYGIGWSKGTNKAAGSYAHAGIAGDKDTTVRDAALAMVPTTPAIVFGSFYAPHPCRVRQVVVWWKPNDAGVVGSTTGYRRDAEPVFLLDPWPSTLVQWPSVIRSCHQSISAIVTETGHPHTKPVDLLRQLMERAPDGVIADPFMGSGSTLRAAKDLGRKAIGVEVDERYCEIAAKRCAQEVLAL